MSDVVEVGGNRLECRWIGPSPDRAPTLVFLHEGLGCVEMWRDFPSRLAETTGCGALIYSRLGYGLSDPCELPRPVSFMHHEGLVVLPELLERLGIERCILVGHSDGGSIAIVYAGGTSAPPLIGLITEAAHVFCEEISVRSIREARRRFEEEDQRPRLEKYHGANTDCAFWGWNDVWLHPDFEAWNIEEHLPGIHVPWLAIQGENDGYGTMAQVESIAANAGGQTERLILPDCGHSPHRDREDETLAAMRDFVLEIIAGNGESA